MATTSIGPASTSKSPLINRSAASISTYVATIISRIAFTSDARISRRNSPNVRPPSRDARLAMTIAASASPIATASVAMWAASDNSASEPVTSAVTASTTTNTAVSANATQRRPTCCAAVRRIASEWSWACPWPLVMTPAFSPPMVREGAERP